MLLAIHNTITDELVSVKNSPLLFNNDLAAQCFITQLKASHPSLKFEPIPYDIMTPNSRNNWDYFLNYEI